MMEQQLMTPPPAALARDGSFIAPQFQECIEACLHCFETCEQMIVHLGAAQNVDPNLIRVLNDAVEISQVSATFMLRGSNFHIRTCAVCAEVCNVCFEALEKFSVNFEDELSKSCLNALKDCSQSCDLMARHH